MKYRVRLDLAFDEETDAKALWDLVKKAAKKAVNISELEKISGNIHKCYHDSSTPKPCEIIEEIKPK